MGQPVQDVLRRRTSRPAPRALAVMSPGEDGKEGTEDDVKSLVECTTSPPRPPHRGNDRARADDRARDHRRRRIPRALGVSRVHQGGPRRGLDASSPRCCERTSQLAIEHGEMHRVVIDLDKQRLCRRGLPGSDGDPAQRAGPARRRGEEARAARRARRSCSGNCRLEHAARRAAIRRAAAKRAIAIAGHHIADKTCVPVPDPIDAATSTGKGLHPPAASVKQGHQVQGESGSSTRTRASRRGRSRSTSSRSGRRRRPSSS